MKILVIEDTELQREQAKAFLRKAGFEVDLAKNAEEGLRLGNEGDHDAIVVDLGLDNLPDEPTVGLSLIKQLRRENQNVPILIWSGFDDWNTRFEGKRAGADAYLVKSSGMKRFIVTINSIVRRKSNIENATLHPG